MSADSNWLRDRPLSAIRCRLVDRERTAVHLHKVQSGDQLMCFYISSIQYLIKSVWTLTTWIPIEWDLSLNSCRLQVCPKWRKTLQRALVFCHLRYTRITQHSQHIHSFWSFSTDFVNLCESQSKSVFRAINCILLFPKSGSHSFHCMCQR